MENKEATKFYGILLFEEDLTIQDLDHNQAVSQEGTTSDRIDMKMLHKPQIKEIGD